MTITGKPTLPVWQSAPIVVVDDDGSLVGCARSLAGLQQNSPCLSGMDATLHDWCENWFWAEPPGQPRNLRVRDNGTGRCLEIFGAFQPSSARPGDMACSGWSEVRAPEWWPPQES